MKIAAALTLAFYGFAIFLLLTAPYGSKTLSYLSLFPLSFFLIFPVAYWPKQNRQTQAILRTLCFIVSLFGCFLSTQITRRNDRFTMEVHGVVSEIYRGGHNAPSVRVKAGAGSEVAVENIAEPVWKLILLDDPFIKKNGTFQAHCANRHLYLEETSRLDTFRRK
jgi:hypothetical protein